MVADIILDIYPTTPTLMAKVKSWMASDDWTPSKEQKVYSMASAIRGSMSTEATTDGFINMVISFYSPEVAGLISQLYITKLDEYYKKQKTAKASNSVDFFTQRADSIKRELTLTTRTLARYLDQHRGIIFSEDRVFPAELEIRQEILKQMFITLTLNKEQAAAQLQQDTPIIQVLDHPNPHIAPFAPPSCCMEWWGLGLGLW